MKDKNDILINISIFHFKKLRTGQYLGLFIAIFGYLEYMIYKLYNYTWRSPRKSELTPKITRVVSYVIIQSPQWFLRLTHSCDMQCPHELEFKFPTWGKSWEYMILCGKLVRLWTHNPECQGSSLIQVGNLIYNSCGYCMYTIC